MPVVRSHFQPRCHSSSAPPVSFHQGPFEVIIIASIGKIKLNSARNVCLARAKCAKLDARGATPSLIWHIVSSIFSAYLFHNVCSVFYIFCNKKTTRHRSLPQGENDKKVNSVVC